MKKIPYSFDIMEPQPQRELSLPLRDIEHALSVAGGSRRLADKLFFALQQELPKQLDSMRRQAAEHGWDELWNLAHRMHGSTALCGVPALNQAVEKLEHAARSKRPEEIDRRLEQVAAEISRLQRSQALSL